LVNVPCVQAVAANMTCGRLSCAVVLVNVLVAYPGGIKLALADRTACQG
jgi:hypothetical protein